MSGVSRYDITGITDTTAWLSATDPAKQLFISCTNITSGVSRTITVPNTDGVLSLDGNVATLTGKTITDAASNIIARELWVGSGSSSVSIYGATAPTTGQVLRATSATTATWQTLASVTPGTPLGSVQYNSASAFAGSSSVSIDGSDGSIVVATIDGAAPAVATSGVKMFGAGNGFGQRLGWVGQIAGDYGIVGDSWHNMAPSYFYATGRGTTAVTLLRLQNTVTGTATARAIASTSLLASTMRLGYVSAATAGSVAGWRHGAIQYWRGNAALRGGFFFSVRFGMSSATAVAQQRSFIGMYASAGAFPNSDPGTTNATAFVGFGSNSADTNWSPMCTVGGGGAATVTTIVSGVSISAKSLATELLEFALFCQPNDTVVYWFMRNVESNVYAQGQFTTNLPASGTFLSPVAQTCNGTTALACGIDIVSVYTESPF